MRRFRFYALILLTTLILMLFLGDFLTGREHTVLQDPYSRLTRVMERKYGLSSSSELQSNAMSDYYYNQLKQKPGPHNWQRVLGSFTIARFTGRRIEKDADLAPVVDLEPSDEVYFLCMLPGDKARLAVIHSLFHTRLEGTDPASQSKNNQWIAEEKERASQIRIWVRYGSKDASTSPARWWHENAKAFDLTPDGDPLPATKAVTLE